LINLDYDILIKNGRIIDGAGNPYFYSEIAIKDGKIIKIRPNLQVSAEYIIDATGLIVSPGFIDMHSHTDYILPLFNSASAFIRQGITTCVIGMCGDGLAPIPPDKMEEAKKFLATIHPLFNSLNISWNTFAEYLTELDNMGCSINLVPVVGYNNIRFAGGQAFENRDATEKELESMKSYITEAMEAGAFGMSTGLIYAPQVFSKTNELIELAKIVSKYNGLYFSHIRSEGEAIIDAIKEVIEIVEKSGCVGGQIAHHKIAGLSYWGLSKETIKLMEYANKKGINISCDQYPYNRGMTSITAALPPWVHEGGNEKLLERIKNPKERNHIIKDVVKGIKGWEDFIKEDSFEHIYLSAANTKKWKDVEGKSISEITKLKNKKDDWETYFEIILDEKGSSIITIEDMGEEDIRRILKSRYQMVGTDGLAFPIRPRLGKYHPRSFGTYPRILGKYVREEKVLTLEEAIRKMTSFPAQRLGLQDRGLIRENMWADIVIFNPDIIIDKATYDDPYQFPEGIPYVLVNGIIAVENNRQNKVFPGKVLRKK
jgi:N-acyl-D-amino-acid deacylase